VIASPSGSVAVAVKVISEFSAPFIDAGAVTTGARSVFWTVRAIVIEELDTPSLAVIGTEKVPAHVKPGVPLSVPVACPTPGDEEKEIPQNGLGPVRVTVADGSCDLAVIVTLKKTPSWAVTVAGPVMTGGAF
jgi:hypothetical protein